MDFVVTYAQNREDIILSAFFSSIEKGCYVDVGAFDPTIDSVTRYFYDRGWNGINIEPNKKLFKAFLEQRPLDINLNIAISDKKSEKNFRQYLDSPGLSTINTETKNIYSKTHNTLTERFEDVPVQTDSLENIFKEYEIKNIQFLKIDVEGYELEVIKGNNWKYFRPEVICIEANHMTNDWQSYLKEVSYEEIFFDGLNKYYTDKLNSAIAERFHYIEMVIGREIVPYKQAQTIHTLTMDLSKVRSSVDSLIQKNLKMSEYITSLENTLIMNRRLRNQIKGTLTAVDNVIRTRIDNLGRRRYNHINFTYKNSDTLNNLLLLAHSVDSKTFENKRGIRLYKVLYHVIDTPYRFIRYVLKIMLKKALRLFRSIKRMGRKE